MRRGVHFWVRTNPACYRMTWALLRDNLWNGRSHISSISLCWGSTPGAKVAKWPPMVCSEFLQVFQCRRGIALVLYMGCPISVSQWKEEVSQAHLPSFIGALHSMLLLHYAGPLSSGLRPKALSDMVSELRSYPPEARKHIKPNLCG